MASLSSLNSYSGSDTTCQVATQYLKTDEGGNIMMPLMSWYPIHDIGNSQASHGIEIQHTLTTGNLLLSNGGSMTLNEFNSWTPWTDPTTTISSSILPSTEHTKFKPYSIKIHSGSGNSAPRIRVDQNNSNIPVGTGDFCWETWLYSANVQVSNYYYSIVDYNNPSMYGWSLHHSHSGASGETFRIVVNDVGTNISPPAMIDHWRHICVQRSSGVLRVYIDGTKVYQQNFTNSVPTNNPFIHGQEYNSVFQNSSDRYYDQVRYSNIVRYAGTDTITVPTAAVTMDANTIYLLECTDSTTISQSKTVPYVTNAVIDWNYAMIVTPKATSNAHVQASHIGNVYTITEIYNGIDYLNADTYIKFDDDYWGTGNSTAAYGTATWTTRIRNTSVSTYDYQYNVNCQVYNSTEFDKTSLANIYYKPGTVVALTDAQTAYITDTAVGNSMLTITTQSNWANIILDCPTTANVTKSWAGDSTHGVLTLVGPKESVNTSLANLTFLGNNASSGNAMTFVYTGNIVATASNPWGSNPWIQGHIDNTGEGSVILQQTTGSMLISLPSNANTAPVFQQMSNSSLPLTIQLSMLDATVEYGYNTERIILKLSNSAYLLSRGSYWYWSKTFPSNQPANTGYYFNTASWHDLTIIRSSGYNGSYFVFYHGTTRVGSYQAQDGWGTTFLELTFGDYSAPGVVFLDELRISNTVRSDLVPLTVSGYRQPRPKDAATLGVWRFCSFHNNASMDEILTNDLTKTIYDSGTMTWALTSPTGLQSTLTQPYRIEGT